MTFALPEDEDALRDALGGERWRQMAQGLDMSLRSLAKYSDDDTTRERAAWARTQLRESIHSAGLAEDFDR